MIYLLASIHDRSIDAFQPVGCVRAKGEAIRYFQDQINDEQRGGPLYKHPDDFDLYIVGTFDDATGTITGTKAEKIADGKQLKLTGE